MLVLLWHAWFCRRNKTGRYHDILALLGFLRFLVAALLTFGHDVAPRMPGIRMFGHAIGLNAGPGRRSSPAELLHHSPIRWNM
jgi:hypothetical protein